MRLRVLYNSLLATRCVGVFETTEPPLGVDCSTSLTAYPGETSIQDWRASYGNMDVVSFPRWTTVMAGRSGQMSHCSGSNRSYILFVCSLADCYLGFRCIGFGNSRSS